MCYMWQTKLTMKAMKEVVQEPLVLRPKGETTAIPLQASKKVDPWPTPQEKANNDTQWKGRPMIPAKPQIEKEKGKENKPRKQERGTSQYKDPKKTITLKTKEDENKKKRPRPEEKAHWPIVVGTKKKVFNSPQEGESIN